MSDSDSDPDPPENVPELVLETFHTSRVKKNPRLEHFKNIIRQNQGRNKDSSPRSMSFIKNKFFPRFLAKKSREKKSGSLSKNPRVEKSQEEMIMKFSTT